MKKMIIIIVFLSNVHMYCMDMPAYPMKELFTAIENKQNKQVKELLKKHPKMINSYGEYNRGPFYEQQTQFTPLHVAVHIGNYDCVQLLLSLGADIQAKTIWCTGQHSTCLHLVKDAGIANLLLQQKVSVEEKDFGGNTPLYMALFNPHKTVPNFEVAKELIRYGADVNQKLFGNTLLYDAVLWQEYVIDRIKFLLSQGADKNIPNDIGKTPLQKVILMRCEE